MQFLGMLGEGDSWCSATCGANADAISPVQHELTSHAEGSHLRVLPKPCMNLSIHTASDVRLPTLKKRQWGKSVGLGQERAAAAEEWEASFDWGADDRAVTVHSFVPEHPCLWENLDAVMTAVGGRCGTFGGAGWQPNPSRARLRMRWDALSPCDRLLLALPPLLACRPFDRLLSQTARRPNLRLP
jgi:hypothetical protein